MRASVIVPARDARMTLPETLAGLGEQTLGGRFEVIVVDNGSRDDTAKLAERSEIVARVIRRPRGDGPGAARNAGAAASRGEVLAFLDADCRPAPEWLASGVAAVGDHDLVQGKVLPDPDATLGPFDRTLAVTGAHGLFESANLFVTRELFDHVGGFPAGLEAGGRGEAAPFGEDVLFGWRARRAGARTGFDERALAYHEVFARGPEGFLAERARVAMFPALAAQVPELRTSFFYRRLFLSRRSASFDLGVVGVALALLSRRPLSLIAAAPYAWLLANDTRRWGRRAPALAPVELLADAVGAAALIRGSVASGSPVL
ncbi:MAG TPA: glycosyltransferase family A protein [Solirubrobacteraceae bacterium]|jgi:GT2 family glycosyltransferase